MRTAWGPGVGALDEAAAKSKTFRTIPDPPSPYRVVTGTNLDGLTGYVVQKSVYDMERSYWRHEDVTALLPLIKAEHVFEHLMRGQVKP